MQQQPQIPRPIIGREYVEKIPQAIFGNIRRRVTVAAISDISVICPGGTIRLPDGEQGDCVQIFSRADFFELFDGEFVDEARRAVA